jgi:hypothetical protein
LRGERGHEVRKGRDRKYGWLVFDASAPHLALRYFLRRSDLISPTASMPDTMQIPQIFGEAASGG